MNCYPSELTLVLYLHFISAIHLFFYRHWMFPIYWTYCSITQDRGATFSCLVPVVSVISHTPSPPPPREFRVYAMIALYFCHSYSYIDGTLEFCFSYCCYYSYSVKGTLLSCCITFVTDANVYSGTLLTAEIVIQGSRSQYFLSF